MDSPSRPHFYVAIEEPAAVEPVTDQTTPTEFSPKPKATAPAPKKFTKALRLIPSIFITLGSILLANVAWPIVSHQFLISPEIGQQPILSPLQDDAYIQTIPAATGSLTSQQSTPQVLGTDIDYNNAQNWFPTAEFSPSPTYQIQTYLISIPAVNVENALVEVGGTDLDKHLIHFPGTAMPGQLGSPVIFGHSVLRQFYNPSVNNPNRYNSIFSKIMTLSEDDEIYVDYDGIRYTYQVVDKVEVQPEDVFILQQRLNNRELKLITCVPEGTYLRRGVIIAELAELE